MKIQMQMVRGPRIFLKFSDAATPYMQVIAQTMRDVANLLYQRVYANLSGEVLEVRSGKLRDSIRQYTETTPDAITVRVDSDGSVPYAGIQELGGETRPHDIVVDSAKALRFILEGHTMFRYRVHHPGSQIEAAEYLGKALEDSHDEIVAMIHRGVRLGAMG